MTLTSAPVSTRKRKWLVLSVIKNRRLGVRPEVPVTDSTRPARFPSRSRGKYTSGLCLRSADGTNGGQRMGLGRRYGSWSGSSVDSWSAWGN